MTSQAPASDPTWIPIHWNTNLTRIINAFLRIAKASMPQLRATGWTFIRSPSEEFAQIETPLYGSQVTTTNIVTFAMALQWVALGATIDVGMVEHPLATFPSVLEHFEPGVVFAQLPDQLAIGICLSHWRARNPPACSRSCEQEESVLP